MEQVTCHLTKKAVNESDVHKGDNLRSSLFNLIKDDYHDFSGDSYICNDELNKYRKQTIGGVDI